MTKLRFTAIIFICATAASAADAVVDLNISTPAIVKLKARMDARVAKLDAYKNSGAAGEATSGLVEARPAAGMSLSDKKSLRDTLAAENEDRRALFRELALASQQYDAAAAATAYAKSRRQSAVANQFVQHPRTGDWILKKDLSE